MAYPSIITSFPQPTASSRLNNPSHSALENLQSSTIGQIETIIGLSGNSSTLGTIIGDLYSPNSLGGGHVQGAAFGGTGQTTYLKGNILVASSASVLTKLAAGTDGFSLVADSTQATGLTYKKLNNKIYSSIMGSVMNKGGVETSMFSVSIPANTLSTNNIIRATVQLGNFQGNNGGSIMLRGQYGSGTVASMLILKTFDTGASTSIRGELQYLIFARGATNMQQHRLSLNVVWPQLATGVSSVLAVILTSVAGTDSTVNQTMGVTAYLSNNGDQVQTDSLIIENIS